jgi:uncharacterized damage-inducible protein DinB
MGRAKVMEMALRGEQAHPDPEKAVAGLDWRTAGERPASAARSIHELLWHVVYWQDLDLAWIRGESPPLPDDIENVWPPAPAPADADEWNALTTRFSAGLAETRDLLAEEDHEAPVPALPGDGKRIEVMQTIASHLSYHLGQIVMLRRMLGAWPPEGAEDD